MTTINIIDIKYADANSTRNYYVLENGRWFRNTEVTTLNSGILETTTSSRVCSAEDVIMELLLSIGREDVTIITYRRFGTPIPVQVRDRFSPHAPLINMLGNWPDVELKDPSPNRAAKELASTD